MTSSTRDTLLMVSRVLIYFGILCYLTSCAMDLNTGLDEERRLPPSGGDVGPLELDGGTVLEVDVQQQIERSSGSFSRWAFVTVEVLDENKNYLTGFGGEFWHAAGYDDGYWREEETEYQNKITIPEDGTYFLRFKSESDVPPSELSRIWVDIEADLGSSLPHHVAAILAFIFGGGLWWFARTRAVVRSS